MAYTTTTTTGYGTRVGNSFKAIGTGFVLFALGTALLWWNEGRAVKTATKLEEAGDVAVHVEDVSSVDPSLNGQLIHATAETATEDVLSDDEFGISMVAIKLERNVEYYQYQESSSSKSKDKLGGSEETTTTYTYKAQWCSGPVDSNEFEDPAYQSKNTTLVQYEDETFKATTVEFGGYKFGENLISSIPGYVDTKLDISDSILNLWDKRIIAQKGETVKKEVANTNDSVETTETVVDDRQYVHVKKNTIYFGKNPNSPEIGDVRVTFRQVNPGKVSVLAKVNEDNLGVFVAKNGKTLSIIKSGVVSKEEMLSQEEASNSTWTWVLRIAGILVVIMGLKGIFGFLATLLKVVPFLASIMNFGVGIICSVIGFVWSLLIIAIAWFFYRPILSACIIAAIVAVVGFFVYRGKQKKVAEVPAE